MATKQEEMEALAGGRGCLGKAHDDEPIFIIRAQDMFGPLVVEHWCDLVERTMGPDAGPKVHEARRLATAMRKWARENHRKIPD